MHRFLVSFLLSAAALLAPGLANAAAGLPADARLVAGPSASGVRLYAWVRGETLCTAARGRTNEPGDDEDLDNCPRRYALTPLGHDTLGPVAVDDRRFAYGIAGRDVAAVALTRGDKVLAQAPTVAGTGSLAGLRFFLVDASGEPATELRILDASGTTRRAEQLIPFIPNFALTHPVGARTIARGRRDGARWRVVAYRHTALAPTPLEPTRHVSRLCVALTFGRFEGPSDACEDQLAPDRPIVVRPWSGCSRIGAAATVLAGWRMRRVVAVLTDGRRMAGTVLHPPGAGPLLTAGIVLAGGGVGIRRVEGYDGAGRLVASEAVRQAPFSEDCFGSLGEIVLFRIGTGHDGEPAPAGDLVVADGPDAELCADVGAFVVTRISCMPPPVEPQDVRLHTRVAGGRRDVFGFVPTDIATVRLSLDDGTTISMAPAPLPAAYAGRYREVERVVRADVPVQRRAVAFELLDANGAVLVQMPGPELAPLTRRTTVARWPGGPSVEAGERVTPEAPDSAIVCIGTGLHTDGACPIVVPGMFRAEVSCASRKLVITAWTRPRASRLELETAGGGSIAARSGALPAALGGGRGSIIVAGPKVAARRLVLRAGSRTETLTLRLPPPRSQCGYEHFGSLGDSWAPRGRTGAGG